MRSVMEAVITFLTDCADDNFLDFIEYIFRTDDYRKFWSQRDYLVADINDFLLVDNVPYAVTASVWKSDNAPLYGGQEQEREVLVCHPKVIRRDEQVTYAWAIEPALTLLRDQQFTSANQEFLAALEDYRKGDYGDCLTKCGSAFESTMKIICDRKGWAYSQTAPAQPLLQTVIQHSKMETFFEQPLMLIATIRNRLSSSHGSGIQQRNVPPHIAKYSINATAAAILLIVEASA
jgi:hypothetical protein